MNAPYERVAIAGGDQRRLDYLFPIVQLLVERGHPILMHDRKMGFMPNQDCWRCPLGGVINPEDWAAINECFALPPNIIYSPSAWGGGGTISDNLNYVDIIGARDPNEPGNDAERYAVIGPYDPRADS